MGMKIFSEAVVHTIKEHINAEKGPGSLYLRDQNKALHNLKAYVEKHHPNEAHFTSRQLLHKIEGIARQEKIKKSTLFETGTSSLRKSRPNPGSDEVDQISPSQADKAGLRYGKKGTSRAPSYRPIDANLSSNGLVQLSRSDRVPNTNDVDELALSMTTESEEEEHRPKSTPHKQQSSAQASSEGSRTMSRVSNCSNLGQLSVAKSHPRRTDHAGDSTTRTLYSNRNNGGLLPMPKDRDQIFEREYYLDRHLTANHQKLEDLQKETFIAIQSAATRLLNDSDEDPPLILKSLLESRSMCELCQIIYVVHDRLQILKKVDEQPNLSKARFMQTFLGAAVYNWIFEEHYHRCGFTRELREKLRIPTMFEDAIRNVDPQLYDQACREAQRNYIDKVFTKSNEALAEELAFNFREVTMHFLRQNSLKHQNGSYLSQWHRDLCEVFKTALDLKMESLIEPRTRFRWPRPEEKLDRASMDTFGQQNGAHHACVQVALFPSLSVRSESRSLEKEPEESVVFRAQVLVYNKSS